MYLLCVQYKRTRILYVLILEVQQSAPNSDIVNSKGFNDTNQLGGSKNYTDTQKAPLLSHRCLHKIQIFADPFAKQINNAHEPRHKLTL